MVRTDLVKFGDAVKLQELDERTFKVNFDPQYCVGNVVNGGYSASCMAIAAATYASKRGQPDLVTSQYSFPDRCSTGPAVIVVEDVKKGKMLSSFHVSVWQGALLDSAPFFDREKCRRPLLSYMIFAKMDSFDQTRTVATAYKTPAELSGTSVPQPDFERLIRDKSDDNWTLSVPPPEWKTEAATLLCKAMYVPKKGLFTPGVMDMWVRLTTGEKITQQALPFVADFLPYEMDRYIIAPEMKEMMEEMQKQQAEAKAAKAKKNGSKTDGDANAKPGQNFWMATLAMNLETKDILPKEGVDWLHVRVLSKHLAGGKFDEEIEIRNESGELVMLAHTVFLTLDFDRNTNGRIKSSL